MLVCLVEIQRHQDDSIPWSITFLALFHSSACWLASCWLESLLLHFQCSFNATLKQNWLWAASRRDDHTPYFPFPSPPVAPRHVLYLTIPQLQATVWIWLGHWFNRKLISFFEFVAFWVLFFSEAVHCSDTLCGHMIAVSNGDARGNTFPEEVQQNHPWQQQLAVRLD